MIYTMVRSLSGATIYTNIIPNKLVNLMRRSHASHRSNIQIFIYRHASISSNLNLKGNKKECGYASFSATWWQWNIDVVHGELKLK